MGLLLLVRHGQASFGADDYDVLSPTGWSQGRQLGGWLAERGPAPSLVLRGAMRRHRETVEAMGEGVSGGAGEGAGWPAGSRVEVDERWDEFDHLSVLGAYPPPASADGDGSEPPEHSRREFQRRFETSTGRWTSGETPTGTPPAETYAGFVDRVREALSATAARVGSGENAVVVSSGGVIAVVCALLTSGTEQAHGPVWSRFNTVTVNSSVTRVVVGSTGLRLLTFNEHLHLDPASLTYR